MPPSCIEDRIVEYIREDGPKTSVQIIEKFFGLDLSENKKHSLYITMNRKLRKMERHELIHVVGYIRGRGTPTIVWDVVPELKDNPDEYDELKPCPFCGEAVTLGEHSVSGVKFYEIQHNCKALWHRFGLVYGEKCVAIDNWNKRVSE